MAASGNTASNRRLDLERRLKLNETQAALLNDERRRLRNELDDLTEFESVDHLAPEFNHSDSTNYYCHESFAWNNQLENLLHRYYGPTASFRSCQKAVCNAALDGRNVICIMPTGAGKSLTFQLPALLRAKIPVIISPYKSLIHDQISNLAQKNVRAVAFLGTNDKELEEEIVHDVYGGIDIEDPVQFIFTTPEKFTQNQRFQEIVEFLYQSNRLDRFVLDEAHAVVEQGYDFRKDYRKLDLRKKYPTIPITALTATCTQATLDDLVSNLRLGQVSDGSEAPPHHTTLFFAPLYRPNLNYSVLPRSSNSDTVIWIVNYILTYHPGRSGIIFCLTKNHAEKMAKNINEASDLIPADFYHSGRKEHERPMVHRRWQTGEVKVICATSSFGLGIDKPDVRFVIHIALSKSLDAYAQESGRAGRDGYPADCILLYRPQDFSDSGAVFKGWKKLPPIVKYAQDLKICRKILFANYFALASHYPFVPSLFEPDSPCGHCDNCCLGRTEKKRADLTHQSWQLLSIAKCCKAMGITFTVRKLAEIACWKRGSFQDLKIQCAGQSKPSKHRSGTSSVGDLRSIDLADVCEGVVDLAREQAEMVILHMIFEGFLEPVENEGKNTLYLTPLYIEASPMAFNATKEDLRLAFSEFDLIFLRGASKPTRARVETLLRYSSSPLADCRTDSGVECIAQLPNDATPLSLEPEQLLATPLWNERRAKKRDVMIASRRRNQLRKFSHPRLRTPFPPSQTTTAKSAKRVRRRQVEVVIVRRWGMLRRSSPRVEKIPISSSPYTRREVNLAEVLITPRRR